MHAKEVAKTPQQISATWSAAKENLFIFFLRPREKDRLTFLKKGTLGDLKDMVGSFPKKPKRFDRVQ